MKSIVCALFAMLALCLSAGCASNRSSPGASAGSGGGGVEVFGVIDAGVSHSTTRSSR